MKLKTQTTTEIKLRRIYRELSEEFDFYCPCYLEIVISKRLRSCNGNCWVTTDRFSKNIKEAKITLSKAVLDEFGYDRLEKTFRHELAHLAQYIWYGDSGHNSTFKDICSRFGGSMNPTMAGRKYSHCADTNYVKTIKKWHYTCPCGFVKKMARRMNSTKRGNSCWRCGKCGTSLDKWKETRVI